MGTVPEDAPALTGHRQVGRPGAFESEITADRAALHLSDGESVMTLDRATAVVQLTLREDYDDEALLHPMLSGALAIMNWWHGRDAFHAGAFVVDGRAWV